MFLASVLPSIARMPAYTHERACSMRYGPLALVEEAQRDVAKTIPCANPGGTSGLIDLYPVDVRQVDHQIPVCAAEAVASM